MTSSDWEEIKRLASDFQRAQLSSSLQRLSERNCVEIINKLLELKLIDIHFTEDAKEYVTPAHLSKEIKDELYCHGGRINLTDVSSILNIELSNVERRANDIAQTERSIQLVLGQLISDDYLDIIAEEINEKLHQNGSITVAEIAKQYDLPGKFITEAISSRLGKIISGQQDASDPDTIYTHNFVARHKYQIRGILTGITQPTPVSGMISTFRFQEKLFFSVTEKLISSGLLSGTLSGGRSGKLAVYTPNIYSQAQYDWVDNFLKQNGYLEFDALSRLGISDPQAYIKRHFKKENLIYVPGACIGQLFIDQIDANLDDALVSGGFVDISPFLPSAFTPDVCTNLINLALKKREKNTERPTHCQIFCDTFVISKNLLTKVSLHFEGKMASKADEAIAKGAFKQQLSKGKLKMNDDDWGKNKKEERRKKATGGKSGGGTQGRETKTKSTKKLKGKKGNQKMEDSDDDMEDADNLKAHNIEFMSLEELQEEIFNMKEFSDCPEELIEEIGLYLSEPLSAKFQEVAKSAFASLMSGGSGSRKKSHQQLQEKALALLSTIKLADKGLKEFSDELQQQLCKYLMRTQCSELLNELVLYLAEESQISVDTNKELAPETRLKIISKLNDDQKTPLMVSHKALVGGSSVDQFLDSVDDCLAAADIMQKKKDNKREKQTLQNHRAELLDQLSGSFNAAVTLHLSSLICFQAVNGNLLQASGKFVPQILAYLKPHLKEEHFQILHEFQGLVMKTLTLKKEHDEEELNAVNLRLEELHPQIKEITVAVNKSTKEF